jgi:hypothetical protein
LIKEWPVAHLFLLKPFTIRLRKMMSMLKRRLGIVLLLIILAGCQVVSTPLEPVAFVPNSSAYAATVADRFAVNLALNYSRMESLEREAITGIELLPPSDLVRVVQVQRFAQALGNNRARSNVTLELEAQQAGNHTFTSAIVQTASQRYEIPLGNLEILVLNGTMPGFYAVAQTRGIQPEFGPGELTFTNPTATTYRFSEFLPAHPTLQLPADAIVIRNPDGTTSPLPSDGLDLPPGARIAIQLNWQLSFPDSPLNVEWRPVAVLEGPDGPVFLPLINIIYRNEAATRQPG